MFRETGAWIEIIQIAIQIDCLHGTKYLDPDRNLDCNTDYFALCKQCISQTE